MGGAAQSRKELNHGGLAWLAIVHERVRGSVAAAATAASSSIRNAVGGVKIFATQAVPPDI